MKKILLLTFLFLLVPQAKAQISVDRAILRFPTGSRPVQNVIVRNGGEEDMGIEVVPEVVENPGSPEEKRVKTKDLIISPKRFSIKGKGQRTIRLLVKKPFTDQEQIYRVRLLPQPRGFGDEASGKVKATKLRVVTTVGLLVLVDPKKVQPELEWDLGDKKLTFKNKGNTNIFLDEGRACKSEGASCEELPATRLYPNTDWNVKLPEGKKFVTYRKKVAGEFESFVVQ